MSALTTVNAAVMAYPITPKDSKRRPHDLEPTVAEWYKYCGIDPDYDIIKANVNPFRPAPIQLDLLAKIEARKSR